jgi:hypothetical protein
LTDFRKILKYEISCKTVQGEPSCSMGTGQTDMTLIFTSRNFANAHKNLSSCLASVPDYLIVYRVSHSPWHFLFWMGICIHEGFHYVAVIFIDNPRWRTACWLLVYVLKLAPVGSYVDGWSCVKLVSTPHLSHVGLVYVCTLTGISAEAMNRLRASLSVSRFAQESAGSLINLVTRHVTMSAGSTVLHKLASTE